MDNLKSDPGVYDSVSMPLVIDPIATIPTSALLTGMCWSGDGEYLAWGEVEGSFHISDGEGGESREVELDGSPGPIHSLSKDRLIMGMSDGDLHMVSTEGETIWSHEVVSGCDILEVSASGGLIALVDGGRNLHMLDSHGRLLHSVDEYELNLIAVDRTGRTVAMADDEGNVHVHERTGEIRFTRNPVGSVAERVTALAWQDDGHLVIAKETLGLAAGDENELEVEWWTPTGTRVRTAELSARCNAIASHSRGCWMAQFDGRILKSVNSGEPEQIWRSSYSVERLDTIGDDLLVASWFNLFRIPDKGMEDEPSWQIEHAGIVEHLAVNPDGTRVALGGEDQNDYTESEPILIIDADAEPHEMEVNTQDDPWTSDLQMNDEPIKEDEDDIYADDLSAIAGLLTEEERKRMEGGEVADASSSLLAMLGSDIDLEEMAGEEVDTVNLLLGMEEFDDGANIPPVSNAGEDQKVESDDDGTAVVLLDGSDSYDPDGMVVSWTWRDRAGKVIGDSEKLKVKLNKGIHHFELTVQDNDGATTTDTTTVMIE